MTDAHPPIFAALAHDIEHGLDRLTHRQTRQSIPSETATQLEVTPMASDILTTARADFDEAVSSFKGWAAEIEPRAAKMAAAAAGDLAKLEQNDLARWLITNELHIPAGLLDTATTVLKAIAGMAGADTAAAPAPAPAPAQ